MGLFGRTLRISGDILVHDDLVIEGRIDGQLYCEGHAVVIAASGQVNGTVIARDITVFGRVTGQLVATEFVDVRDSAVIAGDVVARRMALSEAAQFVGRVEPQHLDAAMSVARYRLKQGAVTAPGNAARRSAAVSL